jgi:hypothetical protein
MRLLRYILSQFVCQHRRRSKPIRLSGADAATESCLDCGKFREYDFDKMMTGPWRADESKKKTWMDIKPWSKSEAK